MVSPLNESFLASRNRTERVTVEAPEARLDRYVARRFGLSRSRVHTLLEEGRIRLDGRIPKKSEALEAGQALEITIPPPVALEIEAEDIPIEVVYEDADLAVVNKPAGLVVHPAPGHPNGTLVNALLHHIEDLSGIGGKLRPGIVHRLDKDTSGLMVVAKSDSAHVALSDALRKREVKRFYLAAAWGHVSTEEFEIDAPVGRHPTKRKRMAVVDGGREALTRVRVSERWKSADLLEVSLGTGRTHQIRVHLAHIGHPVVGDPLYGAAWFHGLAASQGGPRAKELAERTPRQFLHAARLRFRHPESGLPMNFEAPLPPDLEAVAAWARTHP